MKRTLLIGIIALSLIYSVRLLSVETPDRLPPQTPRNMGDLDNRFPIGSPAPDFTLQTPEGETISLKSFRGKWVVIEFGSRT
jgi:cytochrome oxidase Cu insertion factor (SCO1/SenC/PrrC family)